ncbi:MAG TPA: ABC transporter permease subunit, partial [Phycisphaerae bacterium]|nr:ABC transporter permease subunit [Phycisphaerae bacterium]
MRNFQQNKSLWPWRSSAKAQPVSLVLAVVVGGVLAAFLIVPILLTIGSGFSHRGQASVYWFGRLAASEQLRRELTNGLVLATTTTLICLVVAVPMALLRAKCRFRGQGLLGVAVLMPLLLPPFVGALSLRRLLGRFGVLNLILQRVGLLDIAPGALPPDWLESGFLGVVVLQVLHLFPIMYLNASASLANVDPAYSQAARNLGAGPIRTFFRITLPLMRPGLFAGGTIIFIWSFTDIGTPLILEFRELVPVSIFIDLSAADS